MNLTGLSNDLATLSLTNQAAVASKRAPIVDDDWLKVFPELKDFRGQQLVHDHMDYGTSTLFLFHVGHTTIRLGSRIGTLQGNGYDEDNK